MKNIADVNSDDILTELNNLDYAEEDLKLLDDEDIRPINNSKQDDDLADFYMDFEPKKKDANIHNANRVDLFTEKTKINNDRPLDKYVEKANKLVEHPKPLVQEQSKPANIDSYLNRSNKIEEIKPNNLNNNYNQSQANVQPARNNSVNNIPNTLINNVQQARYNSSTTASNKVEVKDLNQLFNKVSNNVKGASEIVNRNAEIKKKIEEKFEELRRLQQDHETNKKKDYEEINAYKDEVYTKLQQKKADIEKDLVDLRTNQEKFANEKREFEDYKSSTMANLKKLENDLKVSYDSRNKNIEQVELGLVKRKEQLDMERANLIKEREQLEKEREELTNNLMQFNKLVDDFTNGIDNFD